MDAKDQAIEDLLTATREALEEARSKHGYENTPQVPSWIIKLEQAVMAMEDCQ